MYVLERVVIEGGHIATDSWRLLLSASCPNTHVFIPSSSSSSSAAGLPACQESFQPSIFSSWSSAGKRDLQPQKQRWQVMGKFSAALRETFPSSALVPSACVCKKFKSYRHFLTSCWCRHPRITRLCREGQTHDLLCSALQKEKVQHLKSTKVQKDDKCEEQN